MVSGFKIILYDISMSGGLDILSQQDPSAAEAFRQGLESEVGVYKYLDIPVRGDQDTIKPIFPHVPSYVEAMIGVYTPKPGEEVGFRIREDLPLKRKIAVFNPVGENPETALQLIEQYINMVGRFQDTQDEMPEGSLIKELKRNTLVKSLDEMHLRGLRLLGGFILVKAQDTGTYSSAVVVPKLLVDNVQFFVREVILDLEEQQPEDAEPNFDLVPEEFRAAAKQMNPKLSVLALLAISGVLPGAEQVMQSVGRSVSLDNKDQKWGGGSPNTNYQLSRAQRRAAAKAAKRRARRKNNK